MPFADKLKLYNAQKKYRHKREEECKTAKLQLFNIQNGNVCALCEKQLNWAYRVEWRTDLDFPIAINKHHSICRECYVKLKEVYK
jgi:hypothetical protein